VLCSDTVNLPPSLSVAAYPGFVFSHTRSADLYASAAWCPARLTVIQAKGLIKYCGASRGVAGLDFAEESAPRRRTKSVCGMRFSI